MGVGLASSVECPFLLPEQELQVPIGLVPVANISDRRSLKLFSVLGLDARPLELITS